MFFSKSKIPKNLWSSSLSKLTNELHKLCAHLTVGPCIVGVASVCCCLWIVAEWKSKDLTDNQWALWSQLSFCCVSEAEADWHLTLTLLWYHLELAICSTLINKDKSGQAPLISLASIQPWKLNYIVQHHGQPNLFPFSIKNGSTLILHHRSFNIRVFFSLNDCSSAIGCVPGVFHMWLWGQSACVNLMWSKEQIVSLRDTQNRNETL